MCTFSSRSSRRNVNWAQRHDFHTTYILYRNWFPWTHWWHLKLHTFSDSFSTWVVISSQHMLSKKLQQCLWCLKAIWIHHLNMILFMWIRSFWWKKIKPAKQDCHFEFFFNLTVYFKPIKNSFDFRLSCCAFRKCELLRKCNSNEWMYNLFSKCYWFQLVNSIIRCMCACVCCLQCKHCLLFACIEIVLRSFRMPFPSIIRFKCI